MNFLRDKSCLTKQNKTGLKGAKGLVGGFCEILELEAELIKIGAVKHVRAPTNKQLSPRFPIPELEWGFSDTLVSTQDDGTGDPELSIRG